MNGWTRRQCLRAAVLGAAGVGLSRARESVSPAQAQLEERYLELTSIHSQETARAVYKRGTELVADGLESFRKVLRDRRNGDLHDMDARLYDQLFELARRAGKEPHYFVISGYRSPQSNDKMSARPGSGVAKNSLHMQGRALDVRPKTFSCAQLRDLAIAAKLGGVGYYERSDFVHLDTGRFRTWVG